MFVLFSPSFKAAMFRRFLKVAIATSSIMNEVYNGGLALEFNVSVLKKIIALVGDYVSETWEKKAKIPGKYRWNRNMRYMLSFASRLRLQSFLWNRFAIQRKSWFPRKLWPCCGKSVSVVPFLYQLFDVFDDNASRNSNHYASADFISVFSIFYFTVTV